MPWPRAIRLPLEPLLAKTANCTVRYEGRFSGRSFETEIEAPSQFLADLAGVSLRSISRWRADGGVPIDYAEDAAFALGLHPIHIWGWDCWITAVLGPDAHNATAAA